MPPRTSHTNPTDWYVYLRGELRQPVKVAAAQAGVTLRDWITRAINNELAREGREGER